MFIGHHAVGFAAKRFAPKVSLGWLMAAPLLPDLLCALFIILGIEHVGSPLHAGPYLRMGPGDYPWSHSLAMNLAYALLFAGLYFALRKDRRGAIVLAIGVLSHYLLDWITHLPDVPIVPGSPGLGLGLWKSFWGTLSIEGLGFLAATNDYFRVTRARDRFGSIGAGLFVAFLAAIYVAYLALPGTGNSDRVAWLGLASVGLFVWVAAFDRHREPRVVA